MSLPDGLPARQRVRAMAVIMLGIGLCTLDGTIVNLALPGIARDLHASASASLWVVSAYQVATLALLLPLAALGELIGFRRVLLGGLAVFTLASLACALAPSIPLLAAARAVQGLGAAGVMSVSSAVVRQIYPRARLGRGIALNSLTVAVSSVAGPSVAAAILSVATWHWLFLLNVPLGLATLFIGRAALPVDGPMRAGAAWPSPLDVVLNAVFFSLLFLGADTLGTLNEGGPGHLGLGLAELAAALVLGAFYLWRQRHEAEPLFPLDLLRIPVFAMSMCSSVCAFCGQTLAFVGIPFLLLEAHGRTPLQAGALITFWPLGVVVMALVMGRLIGRVPGGLLGAVGMLLMGCGLLLMATLPAQPSDVDIAWRMAVCGLGFGAFQSPNNHIIVSTPPPHRSGSAGGMLGSARLTGQSLGAVALAGIFSVYSPTGVQGPQIALFAAAGFTLLAAVASGLRVRGTFAHK